MWRGAVITCLFGVFIWCGIKWNSNDLQFVIFLNDSYDYIIGKNLLYTL